MSPDDEVIGVQSEAAPAAYRSWKEGMIVEDRDGDRRRGPRHPRRLRAHAPILRERLDDFVLVSEDELRAATAPRCSSGRGT